ncbi:MAG: hypothetical protein JNM43_12480 [Planctomycetaceae bacterium]|nr:hypothetical protein [Planctomycetaceae bacterium]
MNVNPEQPGRSKASGQHAPLPDVLSLDDLVKQHLDAQAASADVRRLQERLADSLAADTVSHLASPEVPALVPADSNRPVSSKSHGSSRWIRAITTLTVSALVLAAFLLGRFESTVEASPAELLRAAQETHAGPIERVYLVKVERAAFPAPSFALPTEARVTVLGDRFRVEMNRGERRMQWGRDASGTVWMVTHFGRGLQIAPSEAGPGLEQLTDIYSLNLETLLDDVLAHCRLEREDSSPSVHRIVAKAVRPGRGGIVAAEIEVDRETKAIRKLVIERNRPQRWGMKVTFLLTDSQVADESQYSIEGHLPKNASVMTRDFQNDRRREILAAWLGGPADRWVVNDDAKR